MKIVCIDELDYTNITKGKIYNTNINKNDIYNNVIYALLYWIEDDNGNKRGIPTNLFITLEEYREKQLNKILK